MKKKKAGQRCRSVPFLRSTSWKRLREEALERDGHKCVLCGCAENIAVHHIIYRKQAKDLKLELDNLVCLCPSCHYRIHKMCQNILLAEWLRTQRPEQYEWILAHLKGEH